MKLAGKTRISGLVDRGQPRNSFGCNNTHTARMVFFFRIYIYIQFNGILDPKKPNLFEGGADTVMLCIYPVDLRVR